MKKIVLGEPLNRVDGRLKVTGGAKYSGEYKLPNLSYGVLVPATVACGTVAAMDTKAAERAPGVLAVITPFNASKVPGFQPGAAHPVGNEGCAAILALPHGQYRFASLG